MQKVVKQGRLQLLPALEVQLLLFLASTFLLQVACFGSIARPLFTDLIRISTLKFSADTFFFLLLMDVSQNKLQRRGIRVWKVVETERGVTRRERERES